MSKTTQDLIGQEVRAGDSVAHLYKAGSSVGASGPHKVGMVLEGGFIQVIRNGGLGRPMSNFVRVLP